MEHDNKVKRIKDRAKGSWEKRAKRKVENSKEEVLEFHNEKSHVQKRINDIGAKKE